MTSHCERLLEVSSRLRDRTQRSCVIRIVTVDSAGFSDRCVIVVINHLNKLTASRPTSHTDAWSTPYLVAHSSRRDCISDAFRDMMASVLLLDF